MTSLTRFKSCSPQRRKRMILGGHVGEPAYLRHAMHLMIWGTMRHCIHQWLLQYTPVGSITKVWQPFTSYIPTRNMSDINDVLCQKVIGQILVKSWNSCPDQSKYQCTMMVWSTVFTNDCFSRLVGSITKVWQPFTSYIPTRNMSDINDVWSKSYRQDFGQILEFSPWPE